MAYAAHVAAFYREKARRLHTANLGRVAFMRAVYVQDALDAAYGYSGEE